jgi:hypothetical protein
VRRNAIFGNDIKMMNENFSGLWHFAPPSFRDSADAEARSCISALEEGFARGACFVYCLAHEVKVSGFFSCPMAGGED